MIYVCLNGFTRYSNTDTIIFGGGVCVMNMLSSAFIRLISLREA